MASFRKQQDICSRISRDIDAFLEIDSNLKDRELPVETGSASSYPKNPHGLINDFVMTLSQTTRKNIDFSF